MHAGSFICLAVFYGLSFWCTGSTLQVVLPVGVPVVLLVVLHVGVLVVLLVVLPVGVLVVLPVGVLVVLPVGVLVVLLLVLPVGILVVFHTVGSTCGYTGGLSYWWFYRWL